MSVGVAIPQDDSSSRNRLLPSSVLYAVIIVVISPQQLQNIIPRLDYPYVAHRPTRITPAATNFEILALIPGFLICSCSAAGSL